MEIVNVDAQGQVHVLDTIEQLPEEGFIWLDCVRDEEPEWFRLVESLSGESIHERHIHDSLNAKHPSYYDGTSAYDMLIFRSLSPNTLEGQFATRPTAFFLLERLLVTVRPADSRSVVQVRERLSAGQVRRPKRPVGLMHLILSAMVDRFMAMRDGLSEQLEAWRNDLLDPNNPFNDWRALMAHSTQLRRLEMLCEGQEDAIVSWRDNSGMEFDEHLAVRYNDLLEHIHRVVKFASGQQHDVESLVQLHFSATAHRTNEIMQLLTLLSAIFLPLSLIAGIYGMNFERMPELHTRYGYFITLGGMVCLGLGLLIFFRIKKWF